MMLLYRYTSMSSLTYIEMGVMGNCRSHRKTFTRGANMYPSQTEQCLVQSWLNGQRHKVRLKPKRKEDEEETGTVTVCVKGHVSSGLLDRAALKKRKKTERGLTQFCSGNAHTTWLKPDPE